MRGACPVKGGRSFDDSGRGMVVDVVQVHKEYDGIKEVVKLGAAYI